MAARRRTEPLITLAEAAKLLGFEGARLARQAKRFLVGRGVPIVRVGKSDRVALADVPGVKPRRAESVDQRFSALHRLTKLQADRILALEMRLETLEAMLDVRPSENTAPRQNKHANR